ELQERSALLVPERIFPYVSIDEHQVLSSSDDWIVLCRGAKWHEHAARASDGSSPIPSPPDAADPPHPRRSRVRQVDAGARPAPELPRTKILRVEPGLSGGLGPRSSVVVERLRNH